MQRVTTPSTSALFLATHNARSQITYEDMKGFRWKGDWDILFLDTQLFLNRDEHDYGKADP